MIPSKQFKTKLKISDRLVDVSIEGKVVGSAVGKIPPMALVNDFTTEIISPPAFVVVAVAVVVVPLEDVVVGVGSKPNGSRGLYALATVVCVSTGVNWIRF